MRKNGMDISHHQGTFEYQGNLDFIIQRSSNGLIYDTKYWKFLPEVQKVKIRGVYHYFRTDKDPIEQAEFFNEAQGGQGFHFLAIDWEEEHNILDELGAGYFWEFYQHLLTLTNKPIFLYTRELLLRDTLLPYNGLWLAVPLWVARWRSGEDPQTGDPLFCNLGNDWGLWQHSAKGNKKGAEYGVGSTDVDLDVANDDVFIPVEKEPEMKKPWVSKTLIFALLFALVSVAKLFGYAEFVPGDDVVQYVNIGIAVIVAALRFFTKEPIGI